MNTDPHNSTAPAALDYAPRPPRRRKIIWRTLLAVCVIGASLAGWHWGWEYAQFRYWQWRCLSNSASPDLVVYEAEPSAAKALVKQSGYLGATGPPVRLSGKPTQTSMLVAIYRPNPWDRLLERRSVTSTGLPGQIGLRQKTAIGFLGELQTPSGQRRLVVVECSPLELDQLPGMPSAMLRAYSLIPGDFGSAAATMEQTPAGWILPSALMPAQPNMRVFAGQRDPADQSRFAIRYEAFGQTSFVDGVIDDAGRVKLDLREPFPRQPDTNEEPP